MLEAITFDLWATLIEPVDYSKPRVDHLNEILAARGFTVKRESLAAAYSFALERFCDVWQNEHRYMTAEQRVSLMLSRLKMKLAEDEINAIADYFERTVLSNPPPLFADTYMVLKSLHNLYKIGLICDSGMSPGRVMREVLAGYDILKYFGATVFSDEVGFTKPHPSVYRSALRQLGADAHRSMHVGDLLSTDVMGARAVGMKTIWINRKKVQNRDRTIVPDYEICRLAATLDIIEQAKYS
jgi:putative hydrolase of the HAD superfamily